MKLAILKGFENFYYNYQKACEDLNVPYELIDFTSPCWVELIQQSNADAFLVRPDVGISVAKQMYDERLFFLYNHLNKIIYPSYNELFIYENKRNVSYWLTINKIPHPSTQVFYTAYETESALEFAKNSKYPLVYKTYIGSASSGVIILKNYSQAKRTINLSNKKGVIRKPGDNRDRQWGYVIFQEYIPNAKEWRMIKIGDSYFGHQKLKKGKFHSGSLEVGWYAPSEKLLNFSKQICDAGNFSSMCIDIFEDEKKKVYVNELQTVFGSYDPSQMYINGKPGRFTQNPKTNQWDFQEGFFNQNGSNNLRIEHLLTTLKK